MPDFITAGAIRQGLDLPEDALAHSAIAGRLLSQAGRLPAGSVIALQGSWGRGKTDVIARLAQRAEAAPEWAWLWINPWQYGDANLLTPLVLELLSMIPEEKRTSRPALVKAARTVLLAGLSFGMKATSRLVPGASLLADAAGPAASLLSGLFTAKDINDARSRPEADPIATMSVQFKVLVEAVLETKPELERLVVCVDDLDRCLPDRQVALLQALRFLLSSSAEVRFAVAIDPVLARQALRVHYNEAHFDPDLYLDKMFDLRVNLPAVGDADVGALIRSHLSRAVPEGVLSAVLGEKLGAAWPEHLIEQAPRALCIPNLRNPRLVRRVVDRLYLLLTTPGVAPLRLGVPLDARWLLIWLVIAERWPELRQALQSDRAAFQRNLARLHQHVLGGEGQLEGAMALIGAIRPEQRELFGVLGRDRLDSSVAALVFRVDAALVDAGL
ncbi:MAG: hypothetical protein ACI8RZ_005365 [Myxococcota bacterium]|jgi:hypothetical protein